MKKFVCLLLALVLTLSLAACGGKSAESESGVKKIVVAIPTMGDMTYAEDVQAAINAMPLYASLKYYYGPSTRQKRTRFFNYLNGGPQFYFNDKSKSTGYMVGAGGGMRLLLMKSVRTDFYVGYQLNVRGVKPNMNGSEQVNPSSIKFNQYAHVIQVGLSIPIL